MKTKRLLIILFVIMLSLGLVSIALASATTPNNDRKTETSAQPDDIELADDEECKECEEIHANSITPDATGGPDQFGYVYIDSNEPDGPVFEWVEIMSTGINIPFGDETRHGPFPIGFNFNYYGSGFVDFWAGSNGWAYLGTSNPGSSDLSNDCPLPNTNGNENYIAGIHDDLDYDTDPANPGTGYYQFFDVGTCPYGGYPGACTVIEWDGMYHYFSSPPDDLTFEIILFDNDEFLIQILDASDEAGSGSTTGIENSDASVGLTYACNTADSLADNLAILFAVTPVNLSSSEKLAPAFVEWGDPIHYTIDIVNTGELSATNTVMTDVIPLGTAYISGSLSCSSGNCWFDELANTVYWTGTVEAPSNSPSQALIEPSSPPVVMNSGESATNLLQFGASNVAGTPLIPVGSTSAMDILLDQPPNQSNGVFADAGCDICGGAQVLAENFVLTSTADIGQIVFWTGYFPGDTPIDPDQLTVIFHADAGGFPGADLYTETNIFYDRVQTGVVLFGVHEWMHTLTLATPVSLGPGNYWVEIYNDTGFGTDDMFWEVGDVDPNNGIPGQAFAFEAPGVNWNYDAATDMAIQLIAAPAPVTIIFDVQPLACGLTVENEAVINDPGMVGGPIYLDASTFVVKGIEFVTDFEVDAGGFIGDGEWAWGDLVPSTSSPPEAHSGTKLWATNLSGDITSEPSDHYLTKTLDIPSGGGMLSWWDWWDEDGSDEGYVYVDGVEVYFIDADQLAWMNHEVDLTPWAGQTVDVVFYYLAGGSLDGGAGWYIDDISFYNLSCLPPDIELDPLSIDSYQMVDSLVAKPLTITNLGESALDWDIYETSGANWFDNFDSYASGSQMHGQGGWKGWDNNPAYGALVTTTQSRSAPNAVEIVGNSDLVHEYSGYQSGPLTYTAWQYIPSTLSGQTYFILLNTYVDGGPNNWSTQVTFDSASGQVTNTGASGGTLPLVTDQWVEIRVEIDLTSDTQAFYYDNQLLYQGTWTNEVSGGGVLNIGAVDLFANGASEVYYDDISLVGVCGNPDEIPWLSTSPISGSTYSGLSSLVDVMFDSTGMMSGEYTADLCVASTDPVDPVIPVPVTMTLVSPLIELTKTVGLDPNACATSDSVQTTTNTDVTYCYEVMNTGDITLPLHTLVDSELGNVLDGFPYDLGPGASVWITQTATVTEDVTNTATWTAYINDDAFAEASDSAMVDVLWPEIMLNKTVGVDPNVCAATDSISVPVGSDVTYCFEVSNTGEETLPFHDLVDSELGVILDDFAYDLSPGDSVFITQTVTVMTDTVNTATWTAFVDEVIYAEAGDSATVTVYTEGYMIYLPNVMRVDVP